MKKSRDNQPSRNATVELTPDEARKKRKQLLELAGKEADKRGKNPDTDDSEDGALATFILPGD